MECVKSPENECVGVYVGVVVLNQILRGVGGEKEGVNQKNLCGRGVYI